VANRFEGARASVGREEVEEQFRELRAPLAALLAGIKNIFLF